MGLSLIVNFDYVVFFRWLLRLLLQGWALSGMSSGASRVALTTAILGLGVLFVGAVRARVDQHLLNGAVHEARLLGCDVLISVCGHYRPTCTTKGLLWLLLGLILLSCELV